MAENKYAVCDFLFFLPITFQHLCNLPGTGAGMATLVVYFLVKE